jgi:hypothetical protein
MENPTPTDIGGIKIPKPQSNTYQRQMAVASEKVREETTSMSHNTFRPDIYRVSEGYIS